MAHTVEAATFEEFLKAPDRLAERGASPASAQGREGAPVGETSPAPPSTAKQPKVSSRKEKVGLTIDSSIIDAIEDYIYRARKQGRRLKKNDVYEAALRQFLGLEEDDAR